mmetsp:Transcript_47313/g.118149  ORF Transcript_47313/g.118149 Transcript_47313/m.118149 type:complete len:267 (-) Transcript_47313:1174-1974(-)
MAAGADKHEGRVWCVVAAVDGLWLVDVTVSEVFHPRARSPLCRADVWSTLHVHVRAGLLRGSMSPCLQVCADGWMDGWVLPLHLGRGAAWPYANMQSLVFFELWWLLTLSIGACGVCNQLHPRIGSDGFCTYVCMCRGRGVLSECIRRARCVCTGSIFLPFAHRCECVYERDVHKGIITYIRTYIRHIHNGAVCVIHSLMSLMCGACVCGCDEVGPIKIRVDIPSISIRYFLSNPSSSCCALTHSYIAHTHTHTYTHTYIRTHVHT